MSITEYRKYLAANGIATSGEGALLAAAKRRGKGSRDPQEKPRELLQQIYTGGLPPPSLELVFAPPRKWRFDFAWPSRLVAAEFEGGIWTGGDHTRGKRYQGDCEKYNQAGLLGWQVFRFTHDHIASGYAFGVLQDALRLAAQR